MHNNLKIAILHFQPLEKYPPVMNMIKFLQDKPNLAISVFSTFSKEKKGKLFKSPTSKIFRFGSESTSLGRYFTYLYFNIFSFFKLLFYRPDFIFYYETYSSLPALWYKKLFKKTRLLIHYHEYVSANEYRTGSRYLLWLHKKEIKMYQRAEWISHTNEKRMKLFEDDIQMKLSNSFIMPNYPSKEWLINNHIKDYEFPLKVVYIGALNIKTIFSKEFAVWVEEQKGKVIWEVYSQQDPSSFLGYLESIGSKYCKYCGFVNYDELPSVLKKYDVGVILYKGHIENFVHNAPNKLFEYLSAGLDVWFSKTMDGCTPYVTSGTFPKVIPIDFQDLSHFDLKTALNRAGLEQKSFNFYSEYVFPAFFNTLIQPDQAPVTVPA